MGPLGRPAHGDLGIGDAAARAAFREQLDGLLEGGVDLLILETFHDLDQLLLAIGEVRAATGLPIVASMTFGEELGLADGRTPELVAAALAAAGVDALGVNCGIGPSSSLDALGRMDPGRHGLPGSFMPNAGLPKRIEGQFVYCGGRGLVRGGRAARARGRGPDRGRLLRHDAGPRRRDPGGRGRGDRGRGRVRRARPARARWDRRARGDRAHGDGHAGETANRA